MKSQQYNVSSLGNLNSTVTLERINVFLGANGAGKSEFLKHINGYSHLYFPDRPIVYVEGGRTIGIEVNLDINSKNITKYSNINSAKYHHSNNLRNTLVSRITDAIFLLNLMGEDIKRIHSDAIIEWQKNGEVGKIPKREDPPLNKLFNLFSEIFPEIQLYIQQPGQKNLMAKKNNTNYPAYPAALLSDGEKQVLALLADIALLADQNSVIIVDEPELNLNSGLACKLWDIIENELPDCTFIYATHCVSFALRSNINRTFVISNRAEKITEIKKISDVSRNELSDLLGTIPAILSTNSALLTEGIDRSNDAIFYRWLLGKNDVEIVPMDNCENVVAASNRTGVWEAVTSSVKIVGVIDKDFKSDHLIKNIESEKKCLVLKCHEVESYLCQPKIICKIADGIGIHDQLPKETDIEKIIFEFFENHLYQIAAQRVFKRATIMLAVSVEKNILKNISDEKNLREILSKQAKQEEGKASSHIGEAKIQELINEELLILRSALESKSVDKILEIVPGKELLTKLFPIAGVNSPTKLFRAATKHIKIEDDPALLNLRNQIRQYFD